MDYSRFGPGQTFAKNIVKEKNLLLINVFAVRETNFLMLKRTSFYGMMLFLLLVGISFVIPGFQDLTLTYAICDFISLSVYSLCIFVCETHMRLVLPLMYLYGVCIFSIAIHLSVFIVRDQPAGTALAILVLIPFVLFDRGWRITLFTIICCVGLCVSSALIKTPTLALTDWITCSLFCVLGILISKQMRSAKLSSIESQRLLTIQRDTDSLTGLYNRRRLFEVLEEMADAKKMPATGVIMIDIDNFKKYNDTYGHQQGDDCLRQIGKCFLQFGLDNQLEFFRYGGEEFTALSRTHSAEELGKLSWKLVHAVRNEQIRFDKVFYKEVTVSVGYALMARHIMSAYEDLIDQADKALFRAKKAGGNRAEEAGNNREDDLIILEGFRSSVRRRTSNNMDYAQMMENARKTLNSSFCKACPVCNGKACGNTIPGPGAKGSGSLAAHNYMKWQEIKVNLDTIYESKSIDTQFELFGRKFKFPFFAGPVGAVKWHYGDKYDDRMYNAALLPACAESGIAAFTGDGLDYQVMVEATDAIKQNAGIGIPTIKPWSMELIREKMDMVKNSGAFAVAMDIDAAGLPFMKNMEPPAGSKSVAELKEIVRMAEIPFILKGIMTVKGARKAVEAGAQGIIISNHGGRVLDQCPATAEVLPEIVDAVGGDTKIFVDGGIRTGIDVFKALALGADAALIARPFAVAVYGGAEEGVRLYVEKTGAELVDTMAMCGATALSEIDETMVWR